MAREKQWSVEGRLRIYLKDYETQKGSAAWSGGDMRDRHVDMINLDLPRRIRIASLITMEVYRSVVHRAFGVGQLFPNR